MTAQLTINITIEVNRSNLTNSSPSCKSQTLRMAPGRYLKKIKNKIEKKKKRSKTHTVKAVTKIWMKKKKDIYGWKFLTGDINRRKSWPYSTLTLAECHSGCSAWQLCPRRVSSEISSHRWRFFLLAVIWFCIKLTNISRVMTCLLASIATRRL